jgi:aryl-alcohol dehydrogenase-like predicted oxidoreductase
VAAQQQFNVFGGNQETLELCQRLGLASLCRSPLAMGLLTGKYRPRERLGADDVRAATPYWDYFKPGRMEAWLAQLAAIREVPTAGGRSLAQGALAWQWARSAVTIPIPGFKTVAQGRGERPRHGVRTAQRPAGARGRRAAPPANANLSGGQRLCSQPVIAAMK